MHCFDLSILILHFVCCMYNDSATAVIHAVMYSSPFVCMTSRQIWSSKRAQFDLNTDPTNTHCCCEGGRKEKQMNEWEWMSRRERERDIEKEQHPLPRSRSLCLQSLRKTFQKSTALEFRLRPLRTAADSHTHIHTYLHIYSHVNEPSLTHLSLVIHLLLQTPPAFTALHFTPNHSPPGWRDTPQCVCCAVACSHHWGSDTRKTRCYTSWPFLLIKTPSTYVLVCVNASACLPECLEYKLSPRHLP